MMIAESIMTPMAMAMPPSDMMFELMPRKCMPISAMRMAMGSVRIATSALRR